MSHDKRRSTTGEICLPNFARPAQENEYRSWVSGSQKPASLRSVSASKGPKRVEQ